VTLTWFRWRSRSSLGAPANVAASLEATLKCAARAVHLVVLQRADAVRLGLLALAKPARESGRRCFGSASVIEIATSLGPPAGDASLAEPTYASGVGFVPLGGGAGRFERVKLLNSGD
jgi:hypothetical protein